MGLEFEDLLVLVLVLLALLLGPLLADGRGFPGLRAASTRQLKRLGGGRLNRRQLP
jgi:hypothetical protein